MEGLVGYFKQEYGEVIENLNATHKSLAETQHALFIQEQKGKEVLDKKNIDAKGERNILNKQLKESNKQLLVQKEIILNLLEQKEQIQQKNILLEIKNNKYKQEIGIQINKINELAKKQLLQKKLHTKALNDDVEILQLNKEQLDTETKKVSSTLQQKKYKLLELKESLLKESNECNHVKTIKEVEKTLEILNVNKKEDLTPQKLDCVSKLYSLDKSFIQNSCLPSYLKHLSEGDILISKN